MTAASLPQSGDSAPAVATTTSSSSEGFQNVFDLAMKLKTGELGGEEWSVFDEIYDVEYGQARCHVGEELSRRYNVEQDNQQLVVCVTNRVTLEQTWFNEARTKKPQSFVTEGGIVDPTDGGKKCDFCRWETLTAEDTFGRIELEHAVSESNLFKYCEPFHGVILFKHHDPLHFTLPHLTDLLQVSMLWFEAASKASPSAKWPFFLWNCLNRAGASQFHGHAQVMMSKMPVPVQMRLIQQVQAYNSSHPDTTYYQDLITAHSVAGLAEAVSTSPDDKAWVFPSIAPIKDMEVLILGSSLRSPALTQLLFVALRTLIEDLGVATFNVGILNVKLDATENGNGNTTPADTPVLVRLVSRGSLSSKASDYGGLEVFGGASIGHTDPFRVAAAIRARLKRETQEEEATPL